MPLSGPRRMDALAARLPRRRRSRSRWAILISLLFHGAIAILLLVTVKRQETAEQLPPPAAVTMLFEGGRKNGPTLPNPDLQASPATPPAPAPPPRQPSGLPSPPLPPAAEPVPAPSPPPEPLVPRPPPSTSTLPVPQQAAPLPPKAEPAPAVPPLPAEPVPVQPPPVERRQQTQKLPVQPSPSQAPSKPSDFPAPMDFSFGPPQRQLRASSRPHASTHIPGTIDMSLGPAARGATDATPFSKHDQDAEGADWRNALSRWVAEHAYYPNEARRDGEEGDAKVRVVADPNGRVRLVELIGRSGSMWLDLALQALFRDQTIPPLPSGVREPIDFNFTMHYVLIRPH